MITHDVQQGSPEWLKLRVTFFPASDAPAMLGVSPYKSREDLLAERSTGIVPEVDAATQKRFDDGHRFEALARSLAEEIIGEELFPVVGSEGKYSASFDGLTMLEEICFEHKSLNDSIKTALGENGNTGALPEHYRIQMEQQLMVCGGSKCLFMASKWDSDDNLIEECHGWYVADHALRKRIIAGWDQFEEDLKNYTPREVKEMPKAEVSIELPALFVHAKGEITTSNMKEYGEALAARLEHVRAIQLVTDQDFSNAKEAAKIFRDQIVKLKAAKEAMLSQTVTIGEASRMIDAWSEDLRITALQLEKDVEREDKAKKLAMITDAATEFSAHVEALESETRPIHLNVTRPDFAGAIKGKSKYTNMQEAIDTALRDGKIEADLMAQDFRAKLAWCKENAEGYGALFYDLQQIISKPFDDFKLVVKARIEEHKQELAKKAEADALKAAEAERQSQQPQAVIQAQEERQPIKQIPRNTAPVDNGKTLKLGDINARLGFTVTAEFLGSIGFSPVSTEKNAKLYRECDFPAICGAITRHIGDVIQSFAEAA